MTCIVGVQHDNHVWIGGDSAGVAGWAIEVRADSKVFRVGPYVMGFTTSFRMGQLLRYTLKVDAPAKNPDRFMATKFVDAVRKCLTEGGWLTTNSGNEVGGKFLVGVQVAGRGLLYGIDSDFQIARYVDGYTAVGCGEEYAIGSLHTTRDTPGLNPRTRVKAALDAAAYHSAGVCPPFVIKRTP